MIKIICDYCGVDCDRVSYDVRIGVLHNPVPMYMSDLGEAHITDDQARVRFTLCQKCYREQFKLPNIYTSICKKQLIWREEDEVTANG